MEHSAIALSSTMGMYKNIVISEKEKSILQELAREVAHLASLPIEQNKKDLWYKHNDLIRVRPLIFCDPEIGWNEILPDEALLCEGDLAQRWEMNLRKEIFWASKMKDDRVTEAYFNVPYIAYESNWGVREIRHGGDHGGAYSWEAPIKDISDISMLKYPVIEIDYEKTRQLLTVAEEVFSGILNVRIKGAFWWSIGLTFTLANLRGLEQLMLDMYDNPDELHNLMTFIRDGYLNKLEFLENNKLLSLNNDGTYVGSGGFGWTSELPAPGYDPDKVRLKDMWGFCESQETSEISPSLFEEFVYPYQLPIMEKFGLNCYGCCEGLHNRWDIVKNAPNLRRVSVSPWAKEEEMAEKLGEKFIYSLKPNPAMLAMPVIDEDTIRFGLRKSIKIAQKNNCHLEIIMKDNTTIGNNPENVIRWCEIARQEIESN
jgi:hypothetical protein